MGRRILVVEDDADLRGMLQSLLEEDGYEVTVAEDGLEALRRVVDEPPELIISDVLMPRMTGLEFCALLKDSPQTRHIPLLFLTCVDDPVNGFDVGADDYLVKPFRQRELLARLKAVFRRTESLPPQIATQGLRGNLSELSVTEVLQTLHIGKASGCLSVVTADVSGRARIWLEQGEMVAAKVDGEESLDGEEAFFFAALWEDGAFAFDSANRAEHWTVQNTIESLMLEAARRMDEDDSEEGGLSRAASRSCRVRSNVPGRAELETRVIEIRNRLKLKAFEALMAGRPLHEGEPVPFVQIVDPGVELSEELDELIERMLSQE